MPTTPNGLPYPAASDTPDVPRDVEALAEAVDTKLLAVGPAAVIAGTQHVYFNAQGDSTVTAFPAGYQIISCSWLDAFPPLVAGQPAVIWPSAFTRGAVKSNAVNTDRTVTWVAVRVA